MKKKKTAVQWLEEQLNDKWINEYLSPISIKSLIEQALEMEREQILNTFKVAQVFEIMKYPTIAAQYYEQTYGGQDELPLYTVVVDDDSKVLSISLDIDEQTFGGKDE